MSGGREKKMKKSYYLRDEAYDQSAGLNKPLYINNFGFYRAIESDINVFRQRGRLDYHLLFVENGELRVGEKRLSSGDSFIFYPEEPQKYVYKAGEDVLYYWVHFTGSDIEELFARIGISAGMRRSNGRRKETETLFRLIYELVSRGIDGNSSCVLSLMHALFELLAEKPLSLSPFDRAKKILEGDENISVGEIAKGYGMTAEHFIRSFRAAYGVTPQKYRSEYRLRQACIMLSDTALSVASVAERCGYTDPLYFSRLFKKRYGESPSAYRKSESEK